MPQLKNRKIYGITANTELWKNLYVNFGESRYAYISYEDFVKNVHTWKFDISHTNAPNFQPLLECASNLPRAFHFDPITLELIGLMSIKNNFISIQDKVISFKNGEYLIELNEFVKLKNGSLAFRTIESYNGYTIKFNTNGANGFVIFCENKALEYNIWSIARCKEIIDAIK